MYKNRNWLGVNKPALKNMAGKTNWCVANREMIRHRFWDFLEYIANLSRVDSELNFEQQMALHALETDVLCLFSNPDTPYTVIDKMRKGLKQRCSQWAVHLSCVIKAFWAELKLHDSAEHASVLWHSSSRAFECVCKYESTNRFCIDLSSDKFNHSVHPCWKKTTTY